MANIGANGSVVTFGSGAVVECRDISWSDSAAEIDGTVLADGVHKVVAGASDLEVSLECVGTSTPIYVGDIGQLVVDWNDGGVDDIGGDWVCLSRDTSASLDSEITVSVTLKPSAGDLV